jgi:hypothetical protein
MIIHIKITALLLLSSIALAGCKEYEPVSQPDVKLNHNSKENYRVVLEVHNAPGPYSVTSVAAYGIGNDSLCVPKDSRKGPIGGMRPLIEMKQIGLPVLRVADNRYEVSFYADAVLNENYYRRGICEWTGSPSFYIHWAGTSYEISHDSAQQGEVGERTTTLMCSKVPNQRLVSCSTEGITNENYSGNPFYVKITTTRNEIQ